MSNFYLLDRPLTWAILAAISAVVWLGFVWVMSVDGQAWWAVVFAGLAAMNSTFAGLYYTSWHEQRERQ